MFSLQYINLIPIFINLGINGISLNSMLARIIGLTPNHSVEILQSPVQLRLHLYFSLQVQVILRLGKGINSIIIRRSGFTWYRSAKGLHVLFHGYWLIEFLSHIAIHMTLDITKYFRLIQTRSVKYVSNKCLTAPSEIGFDDGIGGVCGLLILEDYVLLTPPALIGSTSTTNFITIVRCNCWGLFNNICHGRNLIDIAL